MNDNKKNLWDSSLQNLSERHTDEAAETLYKKSLSDIDSEDLILIENDKKNKQKNKLPLFAAAAAIIAVIGVGAITTVILTNSGIFTDPLESDIQSSFVSDEESNIVSDEGINKTDSVVSDDDNLVIYKDFTFKTGEYESLILTEYRGSDSNVEVPDVVDYKTVSTISSNAFDKVRETLKSVKLPDTITTIEDAAFADCRQLEDINIPEGIEEIRTDSFKNCVNLKSITIGKNIHSIYDGAFWGCQSLETAEISDVSIVSKYSFYGCTSLKELSLTNINFVEDYAFSECDSLKTVAIGMEDGENKRIQIEQSAFLGCDNLESVTMADDVQYIGIYAFQDCISLKNVMLGNAVEQICDYAFANCNSLTELDMSNDIAILDLNIFEGCSNLTIKCQKDSNAESYAKEYGYNYKFSE